jgi:hypothetical protein
MRILEFSGMVGYSGFRVRPDLVRLLGTISLMQFLASSLVPGALHIVQGLFLPC